MNNLLTLFLLLLPCYFLAQELSRGPKQKMCSETVAFQNCNNGTKRIFRNQKFKIVGELKRCKDKEYKYTYKIIEKDTGKMKDLFNHPSLILTQEEFSMEPGDYLIILNVRARETSLYTDTCVLTVLASPPLAMIKYGFQRFISIGDNLLLDGSLSKDYNSPMDEQNLEYQWRYKCDTCAEYKIAAEKTSLLVISGDEHQWNMSYIVKLGIKSKWWPEYVYATQHVHVRENIPVVYIDCPVSDMCAVPYLNKELKLYAYCTNNCPTEEKWSWTVYAVPNDDDDVLTDTSLWRYSFRDDSHRFLFIKEGGEQHLESNTNYLATAYNGENNNKYWAGYIFKIGNQWGMSCTLNPVEGTVLETKFGFTCEGAMFGSFYSLEVVSADKQTVKSIEYDTSPNYMNFTIPMLGDLKLESKDYSGKVISLVWRRDEEYDLHDVKKTPKELNDMYNGVSEDSVKNLLEKKDYEEALTKMTIAARVIAVDSSQSNLAKIEPIAKQIISDLGKMPLNDLMSLEKAANIMSNFANVEDGLPPDLSATATDVCRKIAFKYMSETTHKVRPLKASNTEAAVKNLLHCGSIGFWEKESLVKPKEPGVNITTPVYITEKGEDITETFEEYKDDTEAARNIEMYKNTTGNLIDMCAFSGITLLRKLSMNLKYSVNIPGYQLHVRKNYGYNILMTDRDMYRLRVDVSEDFTESMEIYTVTICIPKKNIFWWDSEIRISSVILIIYMRTSEERIISRFENPFHITFKDILPPIKIHPSIIFPFEGGQNISNSFRDNYEKQIVIIVALRKGHSLKLHFMGLKRNQTLNLIPANFRLPVMSDLHDVQQITPTEYVYLSRQVYDHDTFQLFKVIPTPDSDPVYKNERAVTCHCKTLSTIAVVETDIPMKKWQSYIPLPVDLEERKCFDFCLAVLVIFLLYSIVICFAVKEEDHILKAVYLLSDLSCYSRFAYLVVVKTSSRIGSGTTSNVMIKLKGSKGQSEAHVLNYPDPLLLMLQRNNENWFLLATRNNLGTITEIEMWIDGIGACPSWQTEDTLSFFRRMTLMLSLVVSIMAWIIVINDFPDGNATDSIMSQCTYTIDVHTFLHSLGAAVTAALYQIPIEYLFVSSKVQLPWHSSLQVFKRPVIYSLLCWLLTTFIIVFGLTSIIIFGIWIPPLKVLMLLTEVVIGVLCYILVVDAFGSCLQRINNGGTEITSYLQRTYRIIMEHIEIQRKTLFNAYGKYLLRPFLQHLYKPLHGVALRVLWHMEKIKNDVRELVRDLFMFIIYLGLMYMVILANEDYRNVYSNDHIRKMISGEIGSPYRFDEVISPMSLEKYIELTVIEATNSKIWYGKYAVSNPGMTTNYADKVIGIVRLRQHRSRRKKCRVSREMWFMNVTCNADYSQSKSFIDYGEKWDKSKAPMTEGRMKDVWRYTRSNVTGSSTYYGKLGTYSGGGYVAYLGRNYKNCLMNFQYLKDNNWIDEMTRSVFIEFLLYNANSNIFNAVCCVIEKSNTGYLKKELIIDTSKMLLLDSESLIAFPVLIGLFSFLVAVLAIRTILRIKRSGIWYFYDIWHMVDIILIALSLGCVIMLSRRSSELATLVKSLEGREPKEYVNYFPLLNADKTLTVLCAILIAVATMKLWRLFRFMIIFRVLERTFMTCFFPLCALIIYNTIIVCAFALFGVLLFIDHSYRFEGYVNAFEFLLILNLRPFDEEEIQMLGGPQLGLGYVFYVLYAITVNLFNCLFTALIIIYYAKSQMYYSNFLEVYSVKDYLKEQFSFYYNLLKSRMDQSFRLRGGYVTNRSSTVWPKADEERYANSTTISTDKIKAMSLVSLCVIRNSRPHGKFLKERDVRLMTYTLYFLTRTKHSTSDEENLERFYKGHLAGNEIKLVHENVLDKLEATTRVLLGGPLETKVKKEEVIMDENIARLASMKENLSIMLKTVEKISVEVSLPNY